jgi:hypothetical protein
MLSFRLFNLLLITLSQSTLSNAQTVETLDASPSQYICLTDMRGSLDIEQLAKEVTEWHVKLGSVFFSNPNYADDVNTFIGADFVEPYEEMAVEKLVQYADEGIHLAMVALLQRNDVEIEKHLEIAEQLLLRGDTGIGMSYLSDVELISARVKYEEHQKVTAEVKQHIKNSLSYVSYGVQRQDFIILDNYIEHTMGETYPTELQHLALLTKDDYNDIAKLTQDLKERINAHREKMNFIPLSQIDIPDAAIHTSDLLLASAYHSVPNYVESLKLIDKNGQLLLRKTECIEKLLASLFN